MSTFSQITKSLFGRKKAGYTKGDTKERIVDGIILSGNEDEIKPLPKQPIIAFEIEGNLKELTPDDLFGDLSADLVTVTKATPSPNIQTSHQNKTDNLNYLTDGSIVPDGYKVFLGSSGKAERTQKEYNWDLLWWNRIKELSKITWVEIEKGINGLHSGTARRKIAVLRSFSLWQLRAGDSRLHAEVSRVISPKTAGRVPKDRGQKQFKELSEQAKELCAKGDRRGIWIGLMLCCGLRISEIKVVELSHDNTIKVIGKGNKERQLPTPKWLYDTILNYKSDGWRLGRHAIWLHLKRMKIKRPHSLRHTYASQLIRSDFKLEEVKGLLGHAKLDTTLIYAKIKLPDDVAKRLGVE